MENFVIKHCNFYEIVVFIIIVRSYTAFTYWPFGFDMVWLVSHYTC